MMHNHSLDVADDVDIDRQATICLDAGCGAEFERVWQAGTGWSVWYFKGTRTRYILNARSHTQVPAVL